MIICKTKGNTAPGNKPKFYIIAHSEDCGERLESAINILFYDGNPALYYTDDPRENHLCSTSDTYQLIIVLATKSLMADSTSAARDELDYAIKCKMPILPFTFEPDDAELFSNVIGHYHCMFTGEQDKYAKNFFKKLNDYIREITGDTQDRKEIMENAFDMKMFISYRQVDREYVNKYVRMLHANPDLTGIGYWYDEDLTYGNDFDSEIDSALSNSGSDVFLLIVTPNLLQENNYVKEEEYKRASDPQYPEYNKTIIAVEMVPTDYDAFTKMYPNVQYFFKQTEINDSFEYIRSILNDNYNLNVNDHYKTTMLGKAYIYGVGTETDYTIGNTLIRSVAEKGYIPAIDMMCEIYSHRLGVKYEPEELISWRYRYMERCRELLEKHPEISRLQEYLVSLYLYGVEVFDNPNMSVTRRVDISEKIFLEYDHLSREYGIATEDYIDVLYRLGNINYMENNYDAAFSYYDMQINLTERYADELGYVDQKAGRAYFAALLKLADIETARGNVPAAEKGYINALDVAKKNMEEFPCNDMLRDLSIIHSRIGDLYMRVAQKTGQTNLLPLAKDYLINAVEYRHQAYKEVMTVVNLVNLIQEFINAGEICYMTDDMISARQYYNKSTHAFNQLYTNIMSNMSIAQVIRNYAPSLPDALEKLVIINIKLGRIDEALSIKEQYEDIMSELMDESE